MPFGEIGRAEFGTYFIGYAATPEVTEQMLRNMFLSTPPGNTDLLDGSDRGMFFSPVLDFLNNPPPLPGASAALAVAAAASTDGSLAIGSLKGRS